MSNRSNPMPSDWHLRELGDVARAHGAKLHLGLHDDEVARGAEVHGRNELKQSAFPRNLALAKRQS